jgi:catechol 2,3-dioxygenase-like lactoylglutathione lyase family enzyme
VNLKTTFTGKGIPSALYIDHAGFTVPDLEEAIAFFTYVLGCELLYQAGPYQQPGSDWMPAHLNVHPEARVRLAVLRCGPVNNIELVAFTAPDQQAVSPKVSDWGGRHLAFCVTDMEAAVAYLEAQPGVRVLAPIDHPTDGTAESGIRTRYFTTPWGMYLELISRPAHLPYEQTTAARLYRPALVSWQDGQANGDND